MFCVNCGARLADGKPFCSNCGARVGAQQPPPYQPVPVRYPAPFPGDPPAHIAGSAAQISYAPPAPDAAYQSYQAPMRYPAPFPGDKVAGNAANAPIGGNAPHAAPAPVGAAPDPASPTPTFVAAPVVTCGRAAGEPERPISDEEGKTWL